MSASRPPSGGRPWPSLSVRYSPVTAAIVILCTAVELVLLASDHHLIDVPRLRRTAYDFGAVWPGLLYDWTPNYREQPVLMFLTYGFLHIDLWHLATNMVTLMILGSGVSTRIGEWRYLALYIGAMIGGAAAYGVLAPGLIPMIGASGAIFGMAGALVAWDFRDRRALRLSIWPPLLVGLGINVLNLVTWVLMHGQLAWQTHLGGFVTGVALAIALDRPRPA